MFYWKNPLLRVILRSLLSIPITFSRLSTNLSLKSEVFSLLTAFDLCNDTSSSSVFLMVYNNIVHNPYRNLRN